MTGLYLLSGMAVFAWIAMLCFRGRFWQCDQRLSDVSFNIDVWPVVSVVIPARNEQPTIGAAVHSALRQDYPGAFYVFVVDDHSDDGTAAEARNAASGSGRFQLISAAPLPQGWTGKLWAQQNGLDAITRSVPETSFVLFTDADIVHPSGLLRRLVAQALGEKRGLVSLMVALSCHTTIERLLVPAFIFFFQKLYPFPWVNDADRDNAAAAGGCILIDQATLKATGGVFAIRHHLIDDCALARQIKAKVPIWLGLSQKSHSLRSYDKLSDFWRMVSRTAFTQLNYSWCLLVLTVCVMSILYILPPCVFLIGFAIQSWPLILLAGLAIALMIFAYAPTLRLYGQPWAWGITLPIAAALYTAMTVDSARLHWLGRGGAWKGRTFGASNTKTLTTDE